MKEPDLSSGELARFSFDELKGNRLEDALAKASAENQSAGGKADMAKDRTSATLKGGNQLVPGKRGQAILFTGDDAVDTPVGNFKREDAFSISLWMKTPDIKDRAVVLHRSRAWTDAASRGYELLLEEGKLKWSLIHFWPGNAISIRTMQIMPIQEWVHIVMTYDGSSRASGLKLYVNNKLADVEVLKDGLTRTIQGGGGDFITLGERFRDRGFKGGKWMSFVSLTVMFLPQPIHLRSFETRALHSMRYKISNEK